MMYQVVGTVVNRPLVMTWEEGKCSLAIRSQSFSEPMPGDCKLTSTSLPLPLLRWDRMARAGLI